MSDEELILETRSGNIAAQDYILHKFKQLVKNKASAYYITGGDREDIIQEGMIGLYKAIRDYDPNKGASFYSFAELCVSRQILSAIKASARQKHIPLNTSLSLNSPGTSDDTAAVSWDRLVGDYTNDPETLLIGQEAIDDIGAFIREHLSGMEYNVLLMHLQGKRYADIAETLNKDIKSVDNTLQRVRRKIGKITHQADY